MNYDLKDNHVLIENVKTGDRKQIKVGYSWTMMLFGWFVALFRTDWLTLFSLITAGFFLSLIVSSEPEYGIASTLGYIVFAFFYNDLYLKRALKGDWVPADATSHNRLHEKGLVSTLYAEPATEKDQ